MRRLAAALALAAVLAAGSAARGEDGVRELRMTPAAARQLAVQAMRDGRTAVALAAAEGLLAADPDDLVALMVVAAGGAPEAAAAAGRRAHRLADTPERRFEAAWLTGRALSRGGRHEAAKLWHRRALAAAPGPVYEAMAARSLMEARAASPLRLVLTASVGPSDNVNGGSLSDTFWLWGLPFAIPERLSGGAWTLGAQGSFRLHESAAARTELLFAAAHRGVWLSDEARTAAPEARAADFAQGRAEFGLRHQWRPGEAPVILRAEVVAGRQRQGGRSTADDLRLGLGTDWQPRDDLRLSLGLWAVHTDNRIDDRRDADTLRLSLGAVRPLAEGGQLHLSLTATETDSAAADVALRGLRLQAGWRPAARPMGVEMDFTLGLEARDYPLMPSFGTDRLTDATASFGFTRLGTLGFIPEVTFTARRTRSAFTPRDTRELGMGFGIRSKF